MALAVMMFVSVPLVLMHPLDSTEIMYTYAYRQAFVDHKFGYAAATSVVIFIVIAILTVIYVKMISSDREGRR